MRRRSSHFESTLDHLRSDGFSEREKCGPLSVDSQVVDTGAQLDACLHKPLDPAESLRIR